MSWSLERKDEGWAVVDAAGAVVGSHETRVDAIKQQRSLYANEARVASLYADLDALPDEIVEVIRQPTAEVPAVTASSLTPLASELVGLLLKDEREKSLVASMADSHSLISQQLLEAREDRQALVAALSRMGSPTINMPPAEVTVNVPPAEVNFTAPPAEINVTVPDVVVNVPAAQITVQPADVNLTLPERSKTVTFERDPLTHEVTKAEVVET